MAECSLDDFDRIMSVNLRAVFIGIQSALPLMRETAKDRPSGSIINVSSDAAVRAFAMQSIYNTSKGALDVMTRTLGREFAELDYNIRVNGVNPYFTVSEMTDDLFESILQQGGHTDREALAEAIKAPLGRVGTPEDTGQMILFLASEKSAFISGTNTLVDGAASIGGGSI
jgi:NAD(P)-dependent dehydrogenase (short-subunit alcohol dehydrogenase family)